MPKKTKFTYAVIGRGQFPIDMLRYDLACPKTETDSGRVEASFRRGATGVEQQIQLIGAVDPTVGRWSSFGWAVVPGSVETF